MLWRIEHTYERGIDKRTIVERRDKPSTARARIA